MIRYISFVKLLAVVLVSTMLLTGMSCGADGFSIPFAEPTDDSAGW